MPAPIFPLETFDMLDMAGGATAVGTGAPTFMFELFPKRKNMDTMSAIAVTTMSAIAHPGNEAGGVVCCCC